MSETNVEKKKLIIFLLMAYGVTYLMGLLMWYGNSISADLTAFPNAQMLYPAAGVMLACLLVKEDGRKVPKSFFITFLILTLLSVIIAVLSVFVPIQNLELNGVSISVWAILIQYLLIAGSIACWITLLVSGKERRAAYGLRWKNWKASLLCILLFLALYFLRAIISYVAGGQAEIIGEIFTSLQTWIYIAVMPINFFLVFVAFFGEEYGWRYYLQPLLQKRFGLRRGVLLLGVVWGLWHLPVDFFYYTSPDMGLAMLASQIVTCVTLGIFFAYVYMKTDNIWVPVILHFLNNNLVPVIANTYSADVLEDQAVTWGMIPASLLINGVVFGLFILAKEFRGKTPQNSEM